jgi:hypothetical protein
MTIAEIMAQARTLSVRERKELMKLLVDTLDLPLEQKSDEPSEHWGKSLHRLFDQFGPIEMLYPEIEEPIEWCNTYALSSASSSGTLWVAL